VLPEVIRLCRRWASRSSLCCRNCWYAVSVLHCAMNSPHNITVTEQVPSYLVSIGYVLVDSEDKGRKTYNVRAGVELGSSCV